MRRMIQQGEDMRRRPVWSYILVGNDAEGNEIAYYKYEGGTGGSGQSYVYGNKRNKTKLSILINSTSEEAKKLLFKKKKAKQPTQREIVRRIEQRRIIGEARYAAPEITIVIGERWKDDPYVMGPFKDEKEAKKYIKILEDYEEADFSTNILIEPQGYLDWLRSMASEHDD